jgi:lysophospholipase L1-like esterase
VTELKGGDKRHGTAGRLPSISSSDSKGSRISENKRVVLIADNHGKDLPTKLTNRLSPDYNVTAQLYPGARLETIVDSAAGIADNLSRKDTMIIMGGSNNFYTRSSPDTVQYLLRELKRFVKSYNGRVNIILTTIPYRYDLEENMVINKLIAEFNMGVRLISMEANIPYSELWNLERRYHTRHGKHLSRMGKNKYASNIVTLVENVNALENRNGSLLDDFIVIDETVCDTGFRQYFSESRSFPSDSVFCTTSPYLGQEIQASSDGISIEPILNSTI